MSTIIKKKAFSLNSLTDMVLNKKQKSKFNLEIITSI